jgi:uncharacterized protein YtpQ (UPF0354 family)
MSSSSSTKDLLLTRTCSREEFFLLYSKLLEERAPECRIEFANESTLYITNPGVKEATIFLENLWMKYKASGGDRSDLIERHIRFALAMSRPRPPVRRESIVAMVKDQQYVDSMLEGHSGLNEHLCGDLWVVYGVDMPDTIASLGEEEMIQAGVQKQELRQLGLSNLNRILPPVELQGEGPWFQLAGGPDYAASLLLFDELWDEIVRTVDGEVVATVPARDTLLYTGSGSAEGIREIRERSIRIVQSGSHVISDTLILRRKGGWTVLNAN